MERYWKPGRDLSFVMGLTRLALRIIDCSLNAGGSAQTTYRVRNCSFGATFTDGYRLRGSVCLTHPTTHEAMLLIGENQFAAF